METTRRSVYLITYSDADLEKVSTREAFADVWVEAFGQEFVAHWACCLENHSEENKVHFHLAIKLTSLRRWKMLKEKVVRESDIVCNFQEFHTNYYDAFRYVTKEDADYVTSAGHPDLSKAPRTMGASSQKRHNVTDKEGKFGERSVPTKKKKLDIQDVYDIIVNKELRTEQELFLLARRQKAEGKTDLLEFILRLSNKRRGEIIETAWKVNDSEKQQERQQKSLIEILREAGSKECRCKDQFVLSAVEVLRSNNIDEKHFKQTVLNALSEGRKKGNNLMVIGPANCGKTFLLRPLAEIYKTFVSPAHSTFAWVGAEKAEVVFLNDLRWSDKLISWSDFLNFLEGLPIHIQAPKTHFAGDILWEKKTPIFATSSFRLRKYDGGVMNEVETMMMDVRWTYIEFFKPIRTPKEIAPCARCFSKFILSV